jgi:(p)ppGpp synthase/HD superfamily hydrolase
MSRSTAGRAPSVDAAIALAVSAHAGQRRKDGRSPYIVHPIGVLRHLVSDLGVTDPILACGAVLHDVVEDTPIPLARLRRRFGPRVAELVEALTLPPHLHGESVPGTAKTRRLLDDLERMPWGAVLVKLCDRWDNLRDMRNAPWGPAKRRYYRVQTRRLLAAVERRARTDAPPPPFADAVSRALAAIRRATSDGLGGNRGDGAGRRAGGRGRSTRPRPRAR